MPRPETLFVATGVVRASALKLFWLAAATYWAIDLGLDPLQLALLGTVLQLSILLAEVPTGVLADAYSRRWSVVGAHALMGVGLLLAGATDSYPLLVASQALFGVGWTLQSGAETAWLADAVVGADAVDQALIRRARFEAVGILAVIPVTVLVGTTGGLPTAIMSAGIVLVGWSVCLAVAMTEPARPAQDRTRRRLMVTALSEGLATTKGTPALRLLVAIMALLGVARVAVDRLDVVLLAERGLPDRLEAIVVVAAISAGQAVTSMLVLGFVQRRLDPSRPVAVWFARLAGVGAVLVAAMALIPATAVVAVLIAVQGAVLTATEPVSQAWASRHAEPAHRATVISLTGQARAIGEVSGGIVLGLVARAAGVPTAVLAAALIIGLCAVLARPAPELSR